MARAPLQPQQGKRNFQGMEGCSEWPWRKGVGPVWGSKYGMVVLVAMVQRWVIEVRTDWGVFLCAGAGGHCLQMGVYGIWLLYIKKSSWEEPLPNEKHIRIADLTGKRGLYVQDHQGGAYLLMS